ncbi:ACP S-malonyltransferase [Clostridium sp. DJ247]|uniref:ACP S-malonyltransferase n=1 Tax=Clostridium sp. DJ247 TaxID=2726188 RepID=UPI001623FA71|nr:ACP S-malonyltransferase [Clostridium sp. DJ247]
MDQFIKEKHAFMFQGVGAEYQRLLHLLDEEQKEILSHYCSIVYKELELDLWNYLFNSSETKYNKMFNDWIAIYTCDYIVYHIYTNFNIKPEMFMGYSMGLITAMACGKSISFEAGLHMLLNIYEYPQCVTRQEEAMAVIVGMTCNNVEKIIQENGLKDYVEIASENNEYCIIIAGIKSGIDKVMTIAKNEGALKVRGISAPYAFHSSHASKGIERYIDFVEKLQVSDCMTPIISSFDQNIIQNSSDLKKELVRNMAGRMYWKTSIEKVAGMGINSFVEVSLDDSITKFSKLINMDNEFFNFNKFRKIKSKEIVAKEIENGFEAKIGVQNNKSK